MSYKRSIEDFKAVLQGGGVRPTMFQVELRFPDPVVADTTLATNEGTFLIMAAQLPVRRHLTIACRPHCPLVGYTAVWLFGRQRWQLTLTR